MRVLFAIILVVTLLAGGVVAGGRLLYTRAGPLGAPAVVVVPRGTTAAVAAVLLERGVIGAALPFRVLARVTRSDGPIRAAEFAFPAGASLATVLAVLRHGKPVEHELTIPEGWPAAAIARALADDDALAGPVPVPPEGAVLPETYAFERGTTRVALVARMEAAMRRTVAAAWAGRDRALPLRTPAELVTLASMVERETHLANERPTVAAVFSNRLRAGMKLQSDPTVAYGASGGLEGFDRPLERGDLTAANPYNTYVVPGLPVGPICAPGAASIAAAAHPAATGALYFVADGTGGHAFSTTLADQDRNVARWRDLHR